MHSSRAVRRIRAGHICLRVHCIASEMSFVSQIFAETWALAEGADVDTVSAALKVDVTLDPPYALTTTHPMHPGRGSAKEVTLDVSSRPASGIAGSGRIWASQLALQPTWAGPGRGGQRGGRRKQR